MKKEEEKKENVFFLFFFLFVSCEHTTRVCRGSAGRHDDFPAFANCEDGALRRINDRTELAHPKHTQVRHTNTHTHTHTQGPNTFVFCDSVIYYYCYLLFVICYLPWGEGWLLLLFGQRFVVKLTNLTVPP